MPYIQENMVSGYKNGKPTTEKFHSRFSITIPREIIKAMGWKKGDELEFTLEGKRGF